MNGQYGKNKFSYEFVFPLRYAQSSSILCFSSGVEKLDPLLRESYFHLCSQFPSHRLEAVLDFACFKKRHEAWSFKKRKYKKIKAYRKAV